MPQSTLSARVGCVRRFKSHFETKLPPFFSSITYSTCKSNRSNMQNQESGSAKVIYINQYCLLWWKFNLEGYTQKIETAVGDNGRCKGSEKGQNSASHKNAGGLAMGFFRALLRYVEPGSNVGDGDQHHINVKISTWKVGGAVETGRKLDTPLKARGLRLPRSCSSFRMSSSLALWFNKRSITRGHFRFCLLFVRKFNANIEIFALKLYVPRLFF